ncbi:uncharacterized protein FIBRA_06578 [Fibroporia radiculosa]|uniref:cAMP-independent regulatory protein pac2 n=1 Tax=Fibroporia radiculosa TaxID=599839 RepID=J4IBC1_9APHY|nr:uncharacterized protein FIBRA_06578 [Fibroporia radiculosa]CCM04401.1 predicted protein [Fibroporia radiculosa]
MSQGAERDVQGPTHPRLHLRDARDAHTLFEAVRLGMLKLVRRRLNDYERSTYIVSGSVFVWEESEEETGLKRWTDGRIWSQSRMREPYLFYDERVSPDGNQTNSGQTSQSTYRFVDGPSRTWSSSAQSHFDRSDQAPMGLVKQAYSAWVLVSANARPRKWHLTAYFTYADLPNIPTLERDRMLRNLTVPQGVYKSGKSRSRNVEASPATGSSSGTSPTPHGSQPRDQPGNPLVLPPPRVGATGQQGRPLPRGAEDQRMIQMLNSRPI